MNKKQLMVWLSWLKVGSQIKELTTAHFVASRWFDLQLNERSKFFGQNESLKEFWPKYLVTKYY